MRKYKECYLKCKSQKLDFVFFDAECFDNDGNSILDFDYKRTHKYSDATYSGIEILDLQFKSEGYRSSACLYLVRKDYLRKENLFFPPRIVHEDELFTFFLYLGAEKVGLINKSFFHRRVRPNSIMTSSFSERNVSGYLTVAQNLNSFIQFKASSKEKMLAIKHWQ